MKIGILRIGQVDPQVLDRIQENLNIAFPRTECTRIDEMLPLPNEAFNDERQQYNSSTILDKVESYAERHQTLNRVLGIADADLYVQELSFVFGEARCPGKAALISLKRLIQEFYGKPSNTELFVERATKEAIHELGHTFGLRHCSNPFCVMYFSNSIFDTDRKQSLFCSKCQTKLTKQG
jgi:archaemetzincin